MTTDHDRLRDLVLILEDLDGDSQRTAQRHYEECPSCRRLLDAIRETERRVRDMPSIPFDANDPLRDLDAESRAAAERSRTELLESVLDGRRGGGSSGRKRLGRPRVVIPLLAAAMLGAVLLWPRGEDRSRDVIRDFRVAPAAQTRDADGGHWGEGDAFVLRFELARVAYPFVVHVGEEGGLELLHPPSTEAALRPAEPGVGHRLPPAGDQEAWVFEGRGTRETFLLCTSPRADVDLAAVLDELRRRAAAVTSREDAIVLAEEYLQSEIGPTLRRDVRLQR